MGIEWIGSWEIIPAVGDTKEVVQHEGADIVKGEVKQVMEKLRVSGRASKALSDLLTFHLKKGNLGHVTQNLNNGR